MKVKIILHSANAQVLFISSLNSHLLTHILNVWRHFLATATFWGETMVREQNWVGSMVSAAKRRYDAHNDRSLVLFGCLMMTMS